MVIRGMWGMLKRPMIYVTGIIQGKAKRMIWNHFEEKATVFKFKEKYQLRDIRTL